MAPSPRPEHLSPLLRPVERPGESESIAFSQALERFVLRSQRDDFTSLTDFLDAFPRGAWSPALRLQLAEEYYQTGWYSIAVQTLRDLWNERGQGTTAEAAVFSTRVGVRLMELSARLGRREEVEELNPSFPESICIRTMWRWCAAYSRVSNPCATDRKTLSDAAPWHSNASGCFSIPRTPVTHGFLIPSQPLME